MNKHKYLSEQWFAHERREHAKFVRRIITLTVVVIILMIVFGG
jgi:hypothetical protein